MIKNSFLLSLLLIVLFSCTSAQKSQEQQNEPATTPPDSTQPIRSASGDIAPPESVIMKLDSLYPNLKDVAWGFKAGLYKATFKLDNMDKTIFFFETGRVDHQETMMTPNSLPELANDYLKNKLGDTPITAAMMVVYTNGTILYEGIAGGKRYVFDGSGKYLRVVDDSQ